MLTSNIFETTTSLRFSLMDGCHGKQVDVNYLRRICLGLYRQTSEEYIKSSESKRNNKIKIRMYHPNRSSFFEVPAQRPGQFFEGAFLLLISRALEQLIRFDTVYLKSCPSRPLSQVTLKIGQFEVASQRGSSWACWHKCRASYSTNINGIFQTVGGLSLFLWRSLANLFRAWFNRLPIELFLMIDSIVCHGTYYDETTGSADEGHQILYTTCRDEPDQLWSAILALEWRPLIRICRHQLSLKQIYFRFQVTKASFAKNSSTPAIPWSVTMEDPVWSPMTAGLIVRVRPVLLDSIAKKNWPDATRRLASTEFASIKPTDTVAFANQVVHKIQSFLIKFQRPKPAKSWLSIVTFKNWLFIVERRMQKKI